MQKENPEAFGQSAPEASGLEVVINLFGASPLHNPTPQPYLHGDAIRRKITATEHFSSHGSDAPVPWKHEVLIPRGNPADRSQHSVKNETQSA